MAKNTGIKENRSTMSRRKTVLWLIAAAVLVLLGLLFVTGNVKNQIVDSNLRNMEELAEHDEKSLYNSLNIRWTELENSIELLTEEDFADNSKLCAKLRELNRSATSSDYSMLLGDDGTEYRSTGLVAPNAELQKTVSNHDSRFVARYNDNTSKWIETRKEMFVMGIPVDFKNADTHFSWLLCRYDISTLEEELKIDSYDGEGYSSVIDREGNYVVNVKRTHSVGRFDNFFDELKDAEFEGISSIDELRTTTTTTTTTTGETESIVYTHDGEKNVMVIKPLDYADWYFVSTVPESVFSRQAEAVMKPFSMLLIIVAVFGISAFILILRQRAQKEKLALTEQKAQLETTSVLSAMTEDFGYIAAVDEIKQTVTPYWVSDKYREIEKHVDKSLPSNKKFDSIIRLVVHPDDLQMFLEKSDYLVCIEELEKSPNYKFEFRTLYEGKEEYYRIKFAYKPDDHGIVILGLLNIDQQVRREMETASLKEEVKYKDRIEEELKIISGLANDYVSLYTIDLESDSYKIYMITEEAREVKPIVESSHSLSSNMRLFANEFIHEEDRDKILRFADVEQIRQVLENTRSYKVMVRRNYDGVWKWLEMTLIKVEPVDRPAEHVILAFGNRDEQVKQEIKAKQELEDALSASEAASRAKSAFLFNMSHDIRTPMNAIIGYSSMAKKYADNPQLDDYLNKIEVSGKQLLTLVNQVLEMSRIESGKHELSEDKVDLVERADAMKAVVSAECDAKNIRLTVETGGIVHKDVITDNSRMAQIVTNILGNAVKYTPDGGSIDYTTVEKPSDKDGYGVYVLTFRDTGIGMSEEFQQHIFDEFSREKSSTVSQIQGTGLGMSIVKKLVDLMDGEIDIQSKLGEGTTVSITLPMKWAPDAAALQPDAEVQNDISLEGKRILLVEDNEMNREIATEILEDEGVIVETAEDGDIAVEMVRKVMESGDCDYYNAVLMDIQMPRMNGYEATRLIREMPPVEHHVPIIAVSANAFEEDRQKSLAMGMDDHVAKPINVRLLKETLAKYL